MEKIEIYWDDLTKEKQQEILKALGDNGNYDVFPITEIPLAIDEETNDEEPIIQIQEVEF